MNGFLFKQAGMAIVQAILRNSVIGKAVILVTVATATLGVILLMSGYVHLVLGTFFLLSLTLTGLVAYIARSIPSMLGNASMAGVNAVGDTGRAGVEAVVKAGKACVDAVASIKLPRWKSAKTAEPEAEHERFAVPEWCQHKPKRRFRFFRRFSAA